MNDILKEQGYYTLFGNAYTFFKLWANKERMTDELWSQCIEEAGQLLEDNGGEHPELCEILMTAIVDELGRIHAKAYQDLDRTG